jgi:hypothetical protein
MNTISAGMKIVFLQESSLGSEDMSQQSKPKKSVVEKRMGGKQVSKATSTDCKEEFKR